MTTATEPEIGYRAGRCRDPKTARIRELNDSFRRAFGVNADNSQHVYLTRGVDERGEDFTFDALTNVVAFDAFDEDNDPHCEHDFGSFELMRQTVFWKIGAYDRALEYGSPDPTDPAMTTRVLIIMLAEEY